MVKPDVALPRQGKKEKLEKNTIAQEEKSKRCGFINLMENGSEEYTSRHPEYIDKLCDMIREFGKRDDAMEIDDFVKEHNFKGRTFQSWQQKHPKVKEAVEDMKFYMALRRRAAALHRKVDKDMFLRYAHCYDEREKEINAYHDARKQDEKQSGIVVVNVPAAEVTGNLKKKEPHDKVTE
jgi:hypothetical protein